MRIAGKISSCYLKNRKQAEKDRPAGTTILVLQKMARKAVRAGEKRPETAAGNNERSKG